ncbi:hypothetical protein PCAR4_1140011 [Paraburkholderia caribensis]|nr:hypothetical protein PCAR4_1140011 [Paraburkholderia caribensis]
MSGCNLRIQRLMVADACSRYSRTGAGWEAENERLFALGLSNQRKLKVRQGDFSRSSEGPSSERVAPKEARPVQPLNSKVRGLGEAAAGGSGDGVRRGRGAMHRYELIRSQNFCDSAIQLDVITPASAFTSKGSCL